MSGLPGAERGAVRPNWIVNAWNSAPLDVLEHEDTELGRGVAGG